MLSLQSFDFVKYYLLLASYLLVYSLSAQSQSGPSDELSFLKEKKLEGEEAVQNLWAIAQIYADSMQINYQPDSAYDYTVAAYSAFRKLKSRDQEKLEKYGISSKSIRSQRSALREMALQYAVKQKSGSVMEAFLNRYPRLNYKQEEQAKRAFHLYRLEELRIAGSYEVLQNFFEQHLKEIKEYSKDLLPAYSEAAFELYFAERDTSDLFNLLELVEGFPTIAPRMDDALAAAISRKPFIQIAEKGLARINKKYLPKTVAAIYEYYNFRGTYKDLLDFAKTYPDFAAQSDCRRDLAIAKKALPLWEGINSDKLSLLNEYITDAAPNYDAFAFLQALIKPLIDTEDWEGAATQARRFLPAFGEKHPLLRELLTIIESEESGTPATALGIGINTVRGEYAPVISADEERIYFCRRLDNDEDIYTSEKQFGVWTNATPLANVNDNRSFEAPLSISADGNTLLLFQNGVVKFSTKEVGGWSEPRPLFPPSKKMFWQGGTSISADGKVIIFAARRADCIGLLTRTNIDLFITFKQEDGSWTAPQNMGLGINTPLEDRSPFLHPDMRTLYFSSEGRGGLGEMEVFKTTRIGDSWTNWSEPINLGKAINTSGRDWGYRISTEGTRAYFSAFEEFYGENLFSVELPEALRPNKVATITGRLTAMDGSPLAGKIRIEDLETGELMHLVNPDPETGKFTITLPSGKLYSYVVEGPGLFPKANNLDLRTDPQQLRYEENITVPTITEMVDEQLAMPLKNLFFDTDKYDLKPESFPELTRLLEIMKENVVRLEITGHTDNVGGADYNLSLSQKRAEAVQQYLSQKGADTDQIEAIGKGSSEPVSSNDNEEGRAMNRRVEIRFIELE